MGGTVAEVMETAGEEMATLGCSISEYLNQEPKDTTKMSPLC